VVDAHIDRALALKVISASIVEIILAKSTKADVGIGNYNDP
jgi:hypothetical protein